MSSDGRVSMAGDDNKGGLTCSRSFGDFNLKPASSGKDVKAEDVITSQPEVAIY